MSRVPQFNSQHTSNNGHNGKTKTKQTVSLDAVNFFNYLKTTGCFYIALATGYILYFWYHLFQNEAFAKESACKYMMWLCPYGDYFIWMVMFTFIPMFGIILMIQCTYNTPSVNASFIECFTKKLQNVCNTIALMAFISIFFMGVICITVLFETKSYLALDTQDVSMYKDFNTILGNMSPYTDMAMLKLILVLILVPTGLIFYYF